MVNLPPDWSAFIGLLCSHRVRFLVVGAHALAASGRPRATQDLDVLVEPTAANARRLGLALAEFGFGALAGEAWQFGSPLNEGRQTPPLDRGQGPVAGAMTIQ